MENTLTTIDRDGKPRGKPPHLVAARGLMRKTGMGDGVGKVLRQVSANNDVFCRPGALIGFKSVLTPALQGEGENCAANPPLNFRLKLRLAQRLS
jgi:hypothetical protein